MPAKDKHDDAEQLNRQWDLFLDDVEESTDEAGWLASFEALSASARRTDSEPNAAFVAVLRERLMTASQSRKKRESSRSRTPLGVVHPALLPAAPLLGRLAIAAVLALLIAGAIAVGHWLPPSDNSPIVASALASSIPGSATPDATPTFSIGTRTVTLAAPMGDPITDHAFPTVAPPQSLSSLNATSRSTGPLSTKVRAARDD